MKKSCLYFDKKIQTCILHSPLQWSYLNIFAFYLLMTLRGQRDSGERNSLERDGMG